MARSADDVTTSLQRGLEVLRAYRAQDLTLNNNELVSRTGLPKSTVARFTHTLTALGYLEQQERQGGYRLGARVVGLGHTVLASLPVCQLAQPQMQKFADNHNTSVIMAVGDHISMVYLVYCAGRSVVARNGRAGVVVPMASSSLGCAFLWALPPAKRAWFIARIAAEAGKAADEQLARIDRSFIDLERDGFYADPGDSRHEGPSLAVPLVLGRERDVLALSCGAPSQGGDRDTERQSLGRALAALATDIANTMTDLGKTMWDN